MKDPALDESGLNVDVKEEMKDPALDESGLSEAVEEVIVVEDYPALGMTREMSKLQGIYPPTLRSDEGCNPCDSLTFSSDTSARSNLVKKLVSKVTKKSPREAVEEVIVVEDYPALDSTDLLDHPHMMSPGKFIPEIINQENWRKYRFQCPSAGLFQCRKTGLVFGMKGQGEVLYRTIPWDRKLLAQAGKRPAGPLFEFTCNKGSVCQLHLPHCEIHSEGGCDSLSVAYVKDNDSMMFINPVQIMESHVILNIHGFSEYGITKETNAPPSPIRAVVLLFYELPDVNNKSILNILMLPKNVDLGKVCEKRKNREGNREQYIKTNPNCELILNHIMTPIQSNLLYEHHRDRSGCRLIS
ncbi:hypothetical protein UPYG_G00054200 [Umbra pygmaea]|uniref:FIIND domain-containing protein n=1 Tax=Umbra pygmaea TaxID=75934 RepID=A0ABD0X840_UMBPY